MALSLKKLPKLNGINASESSFSDERMRAIPTEPRYFKTETDQNSINFATTLRMTTEQTDNRLDSKYFLF